MTNIVVSVSVTQTPLPAANIPFAALAIAVTDNSGAVLPPQTVTTPDLSGNYTATFTGATGPSEATATATALDTSGNTLGTPLTGTESGTGGQPGTFPQPTGVSISVT
jgi:hypothetical protein